MNVFLYGTDLFHSTLLCCCEREHSIKLIFQIFHVLPSDICGMHLIQNSAAFQQGGNPAVVTCAVANFSHVQFSGYLEPLLARRDT